MIRSSGNRRAMRETSKKGSSLNVSGRTPTWLRLWIGSERNVSTDVGDPLFHAGNLRGTVLHLDIELHGDRLARADGYDAPLPAFKAPWIGKICCRLKSRHISVGISGCIFPERKTGQCRLVELNTDALGSRCVLQ